jgi:ABC-2 type transport system permease protein
MTDAGAVAARRIPELELVQGPSALGTTPRRFWSLLWLTSLTDFRLRYLHASLGYVWALLKPLLFFGIVFLFIRQILGFGADVKFYAPMLMLNIMLFQYFQETTNQGIRSLPSREALVRKMRFPRLVIPLSISLTGQITLGLNLIVGTVLILVFGVPPTWTWVLFPVLILWLVVLTTGIELFLAAAFVRFRDIAQLWSIEIVEGSLRQIVLANPMAPIFVQARHWIIDPSAPSFVEAAGSPLMVALPLVLGALTVGIGLWFFIREAPGVGESL